MLHHRRALGFSASVVGPHSQDAVDAEPGMPEAGVGVVHFPFGPLLPAPVSQGEFFRSDVWKPGPASARERNQFGEVLVQRLDSALGHEAEYCFPDS